jgi:hypothetical protein
VNTRADDEHSVDELSQPNTTHGCAPAPSKSMQVWQDKHGTEPSSPSLLDDRELESLYEFYTHRKTLPQVLQRVYGPLKRRKPGN